MTKGKQKPLWKTVSAFTVLIFSFQQILSAAPSEWQLSNGTGYQSVKVPGAVQPSSPLPEGEGETQNFLSDTLVLIPTSLSSPNDSVGDPENNKELDSRLRGNDNQKFNNHYEYERYTFEDAVEQLRPEYASAVIVKDIHEENLKALGELGFEVAVLVLHGEIVLVTSGSEDEIGVLPAVRDLIGKASFISHTHPNEHSTEGPSGQDINEAVEAPREEYVITRQGVYAYNNQGLLNDGKPYSYDWYVTKLKEALSSPNVLVGDPELDSRFLGNDRQTQARADLNQFIAEQDRYNQASEEERVTFRRGGTLSYTAGLTTSSVTTLSGSPYPYFKAGSTAETTLSTLSSSQFSLGYSVPNAADTSGFTISFDNASTAGIETQSISALTNLVFGLKGPNNSVKLEFIDVDGVIDTFTLTNISDTAERFWQIPVSSISSALDKTKIREINFVVKQENTVSAARTGTLVIRTKGVRSGATGSPVVSSFPAVSNQSSVTISGTKEAHTAILINGAEAVARDSSTSWTAVVNLTVEGNNAFSVTAKNSIGKISGARSITVKKDTVIPTGTININSGAAYSTSRTVTLNLSASDDSSGINKMSFSTNGTTWSASAVYAASKSFTLPAGDGNKTVYVKYYDKAGNVSEVYSKTIGLDTTPVAGTIQINADAAFTNQTQVTLNLTASDDFSGLGQMRFTADSVNWVWSEWENFQAAKSITLPTGDGLKKVYWQIYDKAWNLTAGNDSILLDTTAPEVSMTINDGAARTYSREVTLSLAAQDSGSGLGRMRFTADTVNGIWSDWEDYSTTKTLTLPEGKGPKRVFWQIYDKAGNVSEISGEIILEALVTLPDGTQLFYEGDTVRREILPSGDEILYRADGSLEKYNFSAGGGIHYSQSSGKIEIYSAANELVETIDRPIAQALDLSAAIRMNLEGGLEAYYVDGQAVEFRTRNGIRITDFTLDAEQNIIDALLTYPEGSREIIRKGVLLRRITADSTVTDFTPGGFTVRDLFPDHTDQSIYQKLSQTQIAGLKIQSSTGAVSEYDELGILRKVSDGEGKIYAYSRTEEGDKYVTSIDTEASSALEEKTLTGGTYDHEGGLLELRLNHGQTLQFENGRLKKATDAEGKEVIYSYQETQGILAGLQVTRQGTQFNYSAQGFLETLATGQGTITRTLSDDQTVQILLDEVGGNTLSDFELDSEGKIISGIITTKEGIKQRIEDGVLTGFETADGRVYQMQGSEAVLTEWKFKDGTRVVYADTAITEILFPDGKRLHQIGFGAQKKVQTFTEESPDGTKKFFTAGTQVTGDKTQEVLRLVKLITPTGAVIHYGIDGLAAEVVLPDASAHQVVYARDAEGRVTSITFEGEDAYRTFAPDGEILRLLQDGVNAQMEDGEIAKLFTRFGNIDAPSFNAEGVMSGEISFVDGTKLTVVNGELTQAVRLNGTKIIYAGGRIASIETADAEFEIIYQDGGSGELEAAQIRVTHGGETEEYPLVPYLADIEHYGGEGIAEEAAEILLGRPLHNAIEGDNQTFLDGREGPHTFTANGDAQISTAQKKLGEGSLALDGAGDSIKIDHRSDFEFGASDWTVDFWVKFDAQTQEYALFKKGDHITGGIQINRHAGINRWDIITAGDTVVSVTTTLAGGVWHHIALVRDGGTLRFFENGTQAAATNIRNSGLITNKEGIYLGQHNQGIQYLPGQLDELRMSKTARWTSNFTVPSAEYTRDADTVLLLHFNQDEWTKKTEVLPADPGFTGTPVYFTKLLEDAERGKMAELNSYYFPAWMNLQRNAVDYNGGFISRNVTMDTWDHLPGETADLMDMNGDKLLDRVYIDQNANTGYWWVQYNNGSGFDEAVQWTGVNQSIVSGSGYAMTGGSLRFYEGRHPHVLGDLTDINGDGRPDRVMQKYDGSKEWYVQINNGHGFDAAFVWGGNAHPVSQWSFQANYAQEVRNDEAGKNIQELIADLIDLDGDGLQDRVVRPAAPPFDRWFFQKNNGNGFDDAITWRGVDSSFDPDASIGGSISWQFWPGQDEMGETAVLTDINGDKRPDRVLTKNENPGVLTSALDWYVQLNNGSGFDAAVLWDSEVRAAQGALDARTATSIRYINNANYRRWIFTDLRDVTGDGLPDRITIDRTGTEAAAHSWWVEVNDGTTFSPAVEWTGIYGANGAETAISQDQEDFRANRPHDRTPPYVKKVADLVDMNADGILDRVIFPEGSSQWLVQFGTGSGFLPVKAMQMKGLASSTTDILSSRYDYLHVSLKAAENLPATAGKVKISLGDNVILSGSEGSASDSSASPQNDGTGQTWEIENLTTAWQDFYLPIDKTKGNASSVKVEFLPASGENTVAVYADNVTFTDLRPNAAKDWLDRMLTEENVISEVHSERTQTLAGILLSSPNGSVGDPGLDSRLRGNDNIFQWEQLLGAETKIRFNETGEADQFETFYGSISKIEDGKVTETTLPDGSIVEFSTLPSPLNPQSFTQTLTNTDGSTQSISLSYGRVRQVSREGKSALEYSYEFSPLSSLSSPNGLVGDPGLDSRLRGNDNLVEITVVRDPETGITERYVEIFIDGQKRTQLISRTQANGVATVFIYNADGQLIRSEIVYKGRVQQMFEHGTAESGNTTLKTDEGVIEEYSADGVILFHTTPEGYKYKHTFERAKKAVTTFREESVTLADNSTLTFQVPVTELTEDPEGEEIHRVELVAYSVERVADSTEAEYQNGELTTLTVREKVVLNPERYPLSATRYQFDRVESTSTTDSETGEITSVKNLLDASVFHPDGTVTEFKDGKPFAVVSATGRRIDLTAYSVERIGQNDSLSATLYTLNADTESAAFHHAQALKLWNDTVLVKWNEFQAPGTLPVVMEYALSAPADGSVVGGKVSGALLVREFAEGVVELYHEGKIDQVLSPDGELLIQYSYDAEANPTRIEMGGARRRLESAVKKLQAEVAIEREKALAHVADRESVLNQTIEGQYVVTRDRLLAIRAQIEAEQNKIASISVKGKAARAAIGGAMGQIQAGIDQVNSALSLLASERSNALAQLSTQVAQANVSIETEAADAYQKIETENTKARAAILKQEISPVVYHWYRKILGRDPSQAEYDSALLNISYECAEASASNCGGWLDELKQSLLSSQELTDRTAQVNAIKTNVRAKLNQYQAMSDEQRVNFLSSLGLDSSLSAQNSLLSEPEANAILSWLDTRSLHFGQSAFLALESLLSSVDPPPAAFDRVSLATDLILMDILMGVITPLENDDLVISARAMNLYARNHGLEEANAYAMNYGALKSMYDTACPSSDEPPASSCAGFRVVAHIDGNHYIIITKVTDTEVTYTDPGAGPENALDIRTLSKDEFLQTWAVSNRSFSTFDLPPSTPYGFILSGTPPPEATLSSPNASVGDPSAAVLSGESQMKIRGAFFGFIGKIFKAIWEFVVNTVKAIVTFVVEVVKGVVNAIIHTIQGFGNLFVGLFTGDFKRALKGLYQIFIQPGADIAGGIFTGVIAGMNEHVGTLQAIGFSERTAQKIIQTQIAGIEIVGGAVLVAAGLSSANPYLVGTGLSLVGTGAGGIMNTWTNLSPDFIRIVELGAVAIGVAVGGGINPNLTAIGALKVATPFLAQEFASAGLVAIGGAVGMPPYLTNLINIPVRAIAGGSIAGALDPRQSIFEGIKSGLTAGVKSIGFDFGGQGVNSLFGSLSVGSITSSIESSLGANGLFSNILSVVKNALLAPVNIISGVAKAALDGATGFNSLIQERGLLGAFESLATSIFSRKTLEEVVKAGGMGGFLGAAEKTAATFGGQQAEEWKFGSSGTSLFFNAVGNLIGKKENGVTQSGVFGVTSTGKWGLISGFVQAALGGGFAFAGEVSSGQLANASIFDGEGNKTIDVTGDGTDGHIIIDGREPSTGGSGGSFWNILIRYVPLGISLLMVDGFVSKIEHTASGGSSAGVSWKTRFLFGNGFNNAIVPENVMDVLIPPFFRDLMSDLTVNRLQSLLVPLYETTNIFGNVVEWARDFYYHLNDGELFKQLLAGGPGVVAPALFLNWLINNNLVEEVRQKIMKLENGQGRLEKGIAFSHSGFFRPLLGALESPRDDGSFFDVNTVINYEGPHTNFNDVIDNPHLKRIINIWGTATNQLPVVKANQIPGCIPNGRTESCIDPTKKDVVISDFGPPLLDKANFSGPAGIENINIEIVGARHNDFTYNPLEWNDAVNQFEPERIAQEINRKTNKFMRLLYQFSLTDQTRPGDLRFFLENTTGISFDSANQVWVVNPDQLEF